MCPPIIRTDFHHRYLKRRNSYESEVWHWLSPWQNTQAIQIMLSYRNSLGCKMLEGLYEKISCSKYHCAETNVKELDTVGLCTIYHVLKGLRYNWHCRIYGQNPNRNTRILSKNGWEKEEFTCQCGDQQSLGVALPLFHHFGACNTSESISAQS